MSRARGAARRSRSPTWRAGCCALVLFALAGCLAAPPEPAVPDGRASASSPIAVRQDGVAVWVVNPDHDSVTRIDAASRVAAAPISVGREPWGVAITPSGRVVVLNRGDGSLSVLDGSRRRDLALGPEPGGLALSPTGRFAYVTLSSDADVVRVDLDELRVDTRVPVARAPWAVAVTDDGDDEDTDETVVVTHRFARALPGSPRLDDHGKEGVLTRLDADLASVTEIALEPYAFGFPNVLESIALQGDDAWIAHLLNAPELPRDFETTVSSGLTPVDLVAGTQRSDARIHINAEDFSTPVNFARAVAVSADGSRAYVALAGSDSVMGIDLRAAGGAKLVGFWAAGANPRGVALAPSGDTAYVMNFLSRDVSVLDLRDEAARREVARIPVAPETLAPEILRGKVLFNNAFRPQISHLGWISCATCHPDGGSDTTTWQTPEGPRQTMPLWSLVGTAPFHASATRDELQDFESDIEGLMAGSGLAPGPVQPLLGTPNAGIGADLDALAAYVLTGIRTPAAPTVDAEAAPRGRVLFAELGCTACHSGPSWTKSTLPGPPGTLAPEGQQQVEAVLVDVGTFDASDVGLGVDGFDVPTLLGLHATGPYLHDGDAPTLADVLANPTHVGRTLTVFETDDLVAFLTSIDDATDVLPDGP